MEPTDISTNRGLRFGGPGDETVVDDEDPLPVSISASNPLLVDMAKPLPVTIAKNYQAVAASQTNKMLGSTGAIGDYLQAIIYVPGTSAAGAVSIKDGGGSAITLCVGGGTTAFPSMAPILITVGAFSVNGGWNLTTGANVTCIAVGNFT